MHACMIFRNLNIINLINTQWQIVTCCHMHDIERNIQNEKSSHKMMYHQKYVRWRAKSSNAEDNKDLDLYDVLVFLNFVYIHYMYWKRKVKRD
jgi:hypothetical protein